jgi:hypothetical protein
MKIRLTLEDRAWEHQLRVKQQEPGKYYVELCALDGARLKPAVFTGTYHSLDVIVAHAQGIHLQLESMLHTERALHGGQSEAAVESALPASALSGDPAIDRNLE